MQRTYKILSKSWVAWCNSFLFSFAQVMVFAIARVPKIQKLFLKTKKHFNILWLTVVRFEKPRVFLLKSSWTSSTAAELSSWTWLQLSWASSAAAELFSWAGLQLSWAFSTSAELQLQLWTSLTIHQLNLSSGSWAGVFSPKLSGLDQLNWFWGAVQLVSDPLTSDLQSASQTGSQVTRVVRGRFNRSRGRFNRSCQA
jgi:hypothetical protein